MRRKWGFPRTVTQRMLKYVSNGSAGNLHLQPIIAQLTTRQPVHVIGAGLAGAEAAWQLARSGVAVVLHEMRPKRRTDAHQTADCAELVCSNSFRSDDSEYNAVGLLHWEMRQCGSLIMQMADRHQLPAGGALAVDREAFAAAVTAALAAEPLITLLRHEIDALPELSDTLNDAGWDQTIIATGPLTSAKLAESIRALTGHEALAFFDAIAPIVHFDTVDMTKAWRQSRYDKAGPAGTGADYINCGLDRATYEAFITALTTAETSDFKAWEKSTPYFEACLPIEVMAERGSETLRFGPMKPVGLTDPHTGRRPYAVLQLRQDNALGTLYNLVGFQTKMKYAEQLRVFRMVPALANAEFARLGGLHRNTFINSPRLLDQQLRLKTQPQFRFAGQITGVEGYVESAAIGLLAGRFAAATRLGLEPSSPPPETALGALLTHITGAADATSFQPMNVNFGLMPPPQGSQEKLRGRERKKFLTDRAKAALKIWQENKTPTLGSFEAA
jgi:methylenetetrahydrofolate--tRNA-(uracil-5-)-methyltransferase